MIQYQRHKEILNKLETHQAMSIRRLARELYTSESTIRRDLADMEGQGMVRRVYGGVVLAKHTGDTPAFHREQENIAKKQEIAARASVLIEDGMSIFLDAATTTAPIVPYLAGHKNLTIITNSLPLTEKLGELGGDCVKAYCTGGTYIAYNKSFGGSGAIRMVESMRTDLMLFSSRGLSLNGEITDVSEMETEVRRAMLRRAGLRVFLCIDSRIGRQHLFKLCDRDGYDHIISNAPLPPELADAELS